MSWPFGLACADIAQQADGFGRRVLLARETRDEASAANLAARFEAAAAHEQVAPRRQPVGFGDDELPENDAPAAQQRAHDVLDGFVIACRVRCGRRRRLLGLRSARKRSMGRRTSAQRPESAMPNSAMRRRRRAAAAVTCADPTARAARAARRSCRSSRAQRDELGERLFDLRRQQPRALDDLVEERGAVRLDALGDGARLRR